MAVEVKREADNKDVDHHLRRLELIRRYPPPGVVGKRRLDAITGGVVPPDTAEYAPKAGFFALELTGESAALLDTPQGFAAGEWQPMQNRGGEGRGDHSLCRFLRGTQVSL